MAQTGIIVEYGPYGSKTESPTFKFILEEGDKITKVIIESGDVVVSLGFEVMGKDGKTQTIWSDGKVTGKHNVNAKPTLGGRESVTVVLNSDERITQISGFQGNYLNSDYVVQLRIVTNTNPRGYGPYGAKQGSDITAFATPEPSTVGPIVGFFGAQRHPRFLHALGVSILKTEIIVEYGPYGSKTESPTFKFILEEGDKITKVFIESGDVVVSLGFEVMGKDGKTQTIWSDGKVTGKHNVNAKPTLGGHESATVVFNSDERITQISGFQGNYLKSDHVVQLRIVTNTNPGGYGPYGAKQGSDIKAFATPEPSTVVGPIVGFFGAQPQPEYLRALGVSILKKAAQGSDY